MEEIWKDIPDYPGYQVSNLGRVRTHNKTSYTERHGIRHWEDRILKFKCKDDKKAYRTGHRVSLWKDGKCKTLLVARLVAFTFYEEDINNHNLTVDHIDCNRLNNKLDNLELVSLQENIRREFKNNLVPQKNVFLINKETNEKLKFNSLSKASAYIKRNKGYISNKIKKNIYEDSQYKWKLF